MAGCKQHLKLKWRFRKKLKFSNNFDRKNIQSQKHTSNLNKKILGNERMNE